MPKDKNLPPAKVIEKYRMEHSASVSTFKSADQIPGSDLPKNTNIFVHSYNCDDGHVDGVFLGTTAIREPDITINFSELRVGKENPKTVKIPVHKETTSLHGPIRDAVDRVFSDNKMTSEEALKLEKLRKTLALASVDNRISPAEEQKIIAAANNIARAKKGSPHI